MTVWGKAALWAGLVIALPATVPTKAQDGCEDCHGEFPVVMRGYSDDLEPETGSFASPLSVWRDRFVSSELDRALAVNDWGMKIVGVATDSELPDFVVGLEYPFSGRGHTAHIAGATLAIPGYLYEFLFDARTPVNFADMQEWDERRANTARQMPLAEFGNTQPNPADDKEVASAKAKINARLQNATVKTCEAAIDIRLADRTRDVMGRVLARSHYPKDSELMYPSDDKPMTQYNPFRFHFQSGYEGVAGDTQMLGTKPALMVQATMAMRDYCQTSDRKYLATLSRVLDGLEKKLPKNP